MMCNFSFLGICFTGAPIDDGYAIFGFAEFLTALALLVLVFNTGDFLYKFRVSVAALPLGMLTFGAALLIGFGTLLTDVWFSEGWFAPAWGVSRATIQASFGTLFLATVLLWMWIAFIRPPIFSRSNYRHFHGALFRAVVRGSDSQLPIIAAEIAYSAADLVRLSAPLRRRRNDSSNDDEKAKPGVAEYANETLIMIGNRKLCRHVVASSPGTAIQFMQEAKKQEKWDIPLGEFAHNITMEAIANKDSILYHEDSLYNWDVVGRIQPFSRAMYGDYRLVEGLSYGARSPLDIDWRITSEMDGQQFAAYCRISLLTFKSYIEGKHYHSHSYALYRAFGIIAGAARDISKLENAPLEGATEETLNRLEAAVGFVDNALDFLAEVSELEVPRFRPHDQHHGQNTIFDHLAKLMYDLVHSAAYLHGPPDRAWLVHHNTVWGQFFGLRKESPAWRAVRRRFFRLLFNDVKELERWPNYKGARILGFLLNVQGLSLGKKDGYGSQEYPLRKAILAWAKRNYMALVEANPDIADYAVSGGVSFDGDRRRLVKTYLKGTQTEPNREYLELDRASAPLGKQAEAKQPEQH